MADEKKSGWAAVGEFFADLVKHPEARKKLDETKQRLDEMEKVIGELKDAQVQTVKALNK